MKHIPGKKSQSQEVILNTTNYTVYHTTVDFTYLEISNYCET